MDQIKIGRFIAEMRKYNGYTQKELAVKVGISDKTISKWETGKGTPDVTYLMVLCEALNVSVTELLAGERLSENDYQSKTEKTILALVEENERSRKGSAKYIVIGILLIVMAFIMLVVTTPAGIYGLFYYPKYFVDIPNIIFMFILCTAICLLSGTKKWGAWGILKNSSLSIGTLISLTDLIILLVDLNSMSDIRMSALTCILPLFYAFCIKIIAVAALEKRG